MLPAACRALRDSRLSWLWWARWRVTQRIWKPHLGFLGGPENPDAKALRWSLPEPRRQHLRDFRIGYVLEDPAVPVCSETKAVLEQALRACEQAGASLQEGWPSQFSFSDLLDTYQFHLGAFDHSMKPPSAQEQARKNMDRIPPAMARGALSSFAGWQMENRKRLGYRAKWEKYFADVDVFLSPTTFTAAFPHDHSPFDTRTITLPDGSVHPYWNLVTYICPATLTGCPATAAPVGLTRSGLPVGVQIMAPYMEDATSIRFAQLLAREIGGFQPPPDMAQAL